MKLYIYKEMNKQIAGKRRSKKGLRVSKKQNKRRSKKGFKDI